MTRQPGWTSWGDEFDRLDATPRVRGDKVPKPAVASAFVSLEVAS
jgi:hypothetical protein